MLITFTFHKILPIYNVCSILLMSRMQNSTCTARYKDSCTGWYSKLFCQIKLMPKKYSLKRLWFLFQALSVLNRHKLWSEKLSWECVYSGRSQVKFKETQFKDNEDNGKNCAVLINLFQLMSVSSRTLFPIRSKV